jgi:hypothetical protein
LSKDRVRDILALAQAVHALGFCVSVLVFGKESGLMSDTTKQKPVREITYWPLKAAIWRNEYERDGETRFGYSVVVTRQFRAKEKGKDVWKSTHSLDLQDTLVAAKMLSEAHTIIHEMMAADREEQRDEQYAA